MVISGGVNIYPAEVESALLTLDGIRDCIVFGVPDAEYGERLVAVIDSAVAVGEDHLMNELKKRIAAYKVPREYLFAGVLPREDSGKILKRLVREQYMNGTLANTKADT